MRDKSGTLEDRLISEPFREPMTESSLADGCDEVSEDVVEEAEADWVWACLWLPTAPCDVEGADTVRESCLKCGVD